MNIGSSPTFAVGGAIHPFIVVFLFAPGLRSILCSLHRPYIHCIDISDVCKPKMSIFIFCFIGKLAGSSIFAHSKSSRSKFEILRGQKVSSDDFQSDVIPFLTP